MKSLLFSKRVLWLMILFMTVISTSLYAYAYFENNKDYGFVIETGEFEVTAYIYFNETAIDINSPYYDAINDVVIVNAYDEESENFISKLKVDILVNPNVASRARIQLLDEWKLTRTYATLNEEVPIDPLIEVIYHTKKSDIYHPFSLLKVGTDFQPRYDQNGYAYLLQTLNKNEEKVIHLIDGGDAYLTRENEIYSETCFVYLRFTIEVVQANRFAELWSLETNFFD